MKKKEIWMDIEIREDIDDILTLIYAIEHNYNIKYISIHNPSNEELNVLMNILKKLNYNDVKLIISGDITNYDNDKNIHKSLYEYNDIINDKTLYIKLNDFLNKNIIDKNLIVFCGGSLYTLSKLIEKEPYIKAFIQGGYAGSNIIPNEIALKKFRKRESVPTWNLNLDLSSTNYVLKNHKSNLHFISKNICHKSNVTETILKKNNSLFENVLLNYYSLMDLKYRNKPMHDLLAFLAIENKNKLIEFKEVELSHNKEEIPKWRSEFKTNTGIYISVDFNYDLFLKTILLKDINIEENYSLKF